MLAISFILLLLDVITCVCECLYKQFVFKIHFFFRKKGRDIARKKIKVLKFWPELCERGQKLTPS